MNYRLNKVYLVAILDFNLFEDIKEDEEYSVERVQLVRKKTNTVYSDKLEFIFVELPKFKKTEEELKTRFDKWLFILKNLSGLKERPVSIQGMIFEQYNLFGYQLTLKQVSTDIFIIVNTIVFNYLCA